MLNEQIQKPSGNHLFEHSKFTRVDPQRLGVEPDYICLHWSIAHVLK